MPAISLGLWHNFGGVDLFENSRALILRAFDLGLTHFDLANNYGPPPGSAETNFGHILRTDLAAHRDELIISTKAGYHMWAGPYGEWGSRKSVLASLDQSLRRLRLGGTQMIGFESEVGKEQMGHHLNVKGILFEEEQKIGAKKGLIPQLKNLLGI